MVGRQGLAHLRTDTYRNGRKVNVSSVFAIGCASVHPQCCREFPCLMEHDDRDVSIGGPDDDVVAVSNISYGLGVEADAGVCFGMVASTSMVSSLTIPVPTKKCRHSPRWPTYTCSCMICAYACSFHAFSRNVGNSVLNDDGMSASLKSAGWVCCGPVIL